MVKIQQIQSLEILDSRGNPTIKTYITTDTGNRYNAAVPSGASTGSYEATELRDGDPHRYVGLGVVKAQNIVENIIAREIVGFDVLKPELVDKKMLELDETPTKVKLGANSMLSISLAINRAAAGEQKLPLWQFINQYYFSDSKPAFPRLMVNIINGGKHANWQFDIQEFMVVPKPNRPFQSVQIAADIFHNLGKILKEQQLSILLGDEGGYSPALTTNENVFQTIIRAAAAIGYENQEHYQLAIDAAATEWFNNGRYVSHSSNKTYSTEDLLQLYAHFEEEYHILSFEDPFAEDDFDSFAKLTAHAANSFLVVGDDLYVTNVKRLQKGIETHATNAILIKPNQIGTMIETVQTMRLARQNNMKLVISHRSGETEDSFIADLAYGSGAEFLKTGSMSRSERLAKYNRLLEIEQGL